jgi:hypothetical protein
VRLLRIDCFDRNKHAEFADRIDRGIHHRVQRTVLSAAVWDAAQAGIRTADNLIFRPSLCHPEPSLEGT